VTRTGRRRGRWPRPGAGRLAVRRTTHHGGEKVSTSVVDSSEASRGLRSHVKEPEPTTNADDNVALAA
jgi:hypothetical protein